MRASRGLAAALAAAWIAAAAPSALATEIVEEVVAKVNGDVITKSELEQEEQQIVSELYRRASGKDLDQQVAAAKANLLRRMIEQKLLYQRAQRVFDLDKAGEVYVRAFKEQQSITNDEDLQRMLTQEGMSVSDLKRRLLEMWAPQEVLRAEVGDRTTASDKEVEAYFAEHPSEFEEPAAVTLREIVVKATASDREEKRARATALRAEAAAEGADFAALATKNSDSATAGQGGLLGTFHPGELAPALEKVAFATPKGGVSDVLDTDYGFQILRVDDRKDARKIPLEEVRAKLTEKLTNEKYQKATDAFLKKLWSEADIEVAKGYRDRLASDADETTHK